MSRQADCQRDSLPDWRELGQRASIDPGEPLLLALSGGADSVWLLRSLAQADPRPEFAAAHVDHGLRGAESTTDAEFCAELCRKLDVPFHSTRIELDGSHADLERRAREARYRALGEIAGKLGLRTLLLAHHADDALETLLMRWTRGTSLFGLAGLRRRGAFPVSFPGSAGLVVVRPMFDLDAGAIRSALAGAGHPWREDSSNSSPRFTRNRVRQNLLPWLEELGGPAARASLGALHEALREFDETLEAEMPDLEWTRDLHGLRRLPVEELGCLPEPLLRRVLWRLLVQATGRAPRERVLGEIGERVRARARGKWTLKGAWSLRLAARELQLWGPTAQLGTPLAPALELRPPGSVELPGGARLSAELIELDPLSPVPGSPEEVHLALPSTLQALEVRTPRPGDRFHALGAPGSKPLRRFLADCGLPAEVRAGVPLVFLADELVWVAGLRPCQRLRVLPTTRRRLRLRLQAPTPQSPLRGPRSGDFVHGSG